MESWNILQVKPRVDAFSMEELRAQLNELLAQGQSYIALDLRATRFINLPAIKMIVQVARELKSRNGQLALVGPVEKTKRHFEIYGSLNDLLVVREAEELSLSFMHLGPPSLEI